MIVDELFKRHVLALLPRSEAEMLEAKRHMDFPFAFAAIDGCHIRLRCPIGETSRKDYYNFKNFYSIVLMAMVNGKGQFLWASAGMPGNCHDSTLLQSTNMWPKMPALCNLSTENLMGVEIPSLILGDNAFPFRPFLMKRFTNANRTPEQRTFNRKLSSSRVVIENAFGYLKMRFRELFRGR